MEKFDDQGKLVGVSHDPDVSHRIQHLFDLCRERRLLIQAGNHEQARDQAEKLTQYMGELPDEDLLVMIYCLVRTLEGVAHGLSRSGITLRVAQISKETG